MEHLSSPPRRRKLSGLLAALALTVPLHALASLGADEASIERDRVALSGVAATPVNAAGYTVRAFTLPSGTVIREYLGTTGVVFGVAWEGPQIPDLKQLLGSTHFASFTDGARSRNREGRRGPMELRPAGSPNLVMESTGQMRAFAGRAYLSNQLPAGVDTDAIR